MPQTREIKGARPPCYVSKATLAAELDISESTVDAWVQRGILPKPIRMGGAVRWPWAAVEACLAGGSAAEPDPFLKGVSNVS